MTEPKRKVLKQSSLIDVFQCQREKSRSREELYDSLEMDSGDGDKQKRKRELTARAAERRMEQKEQVDCVASQSEAADGSDGRPLSDDRGSPLLFSDSSLSSPPASSPSSSVDVSDASFQPVFRNLGETTGLGIAIQQLQRQPQCGAELPPLTAQPYHTILVKVPLQVGVCPQPFPDSFKDAWDHHHVRLPCSPESLYPVGTGKKKLASRWNIIETSLLSDIKSSYDLREAILSYNSRYSDLWNFSGLHLFLHEVADAAERMTFFQRTLPAMILLALRLPELLTHPIPLLKQQEQRLVTMSQEQIACLLANAFFCTFPRRNAHKVSSEYGSYPTINFNSLFGGSRRGIHPMQASKLRSLIHYFHRVTSNSPTGTVTFERRVLKHGPCWDRCESKFSKLHVTTEGTIEDIGEGMLQVDFANKFVGGGVLGGGCVQEEIRFLICPELIVSRLFTEELADNESLVVTGVERYSNYTGYSDTFRWAGNHNDKTQRDSWGRHLTEVLAIDAVRFQRSFNQFRPGLIQRELNKAYCGFLSETTSPAHLPAVATGNWGCGAFGGDLHLKGLIQLMAAAHSKRDVLYITFGNQKLCNDLAHIHQFLQDSELAVGDLWGLILQYRTHLMQNPRTSLTVCDFILQLFDTDSQEQNTPSSPTSREASNEQLNRIDSLQTLEIPKFSLDTSN